MVDVEIEKYVFKIKLNRPEKRNAFHQEMIQKIKEAFDQAAQQSDIRAVVLLGEGESFCAGADLGWMKSMVDYSFEENQQDSCQLFDMFKAGYDLPMPLISIAQGHVFGGALGLLGISDLVAAEAQTKFSFSEVKLGLAPAVISPFVLLKMKKSMARRWMLTGELFNANEALLSGLVQQQFEGGEGRVVVDQWLKGFGQTGPEAVRETKRLLRSFEEPLDWSELKRNTSDAIAARRVSEEGQKGLRSFFDKTTPDWRLTWD